MNANPLTVVNRLGFGLAPGEAVPGNPTAWAMGQLEVFEPRPAAIASTIGSADMVTQFTQFRQAKRAAKQDSAEAKMAAQKAMGGFLRQGYVGQASARIQTALTSPTPFAERLSAFWANHFAVSIDKQVTIGLAGPLEFEAIRPNIAGKFTDLWMAVMRHPAMLLYLDQAQSIGPNSPVAEFAASHGRKLGLNENLAREAMELHSLGVRSGYTQADVTELARALTGWSVGGFGRQLPPRFQAGNDEPGRFAFRAAMHEPGARTVLGKPYGQPGEGQARAILVDLAHRPETATHIATKLAVHFVSDTPPPALVQRVAATFQRSGGDLPTVYRALIDSPEAFAPGTGKFKTPYDWTVSSLRALGTQTADQRTVGGIAELGQPIWRPGSPAGWSDVAGAWAGPDALLRRVEVAQRIANITSEGIDPRVLGPRLFGGLEPQTARVIAAADSPRQGLALLLASPQFQRR